MEPEYTVHCLPFGRSDELIVGDTDRMERPLQFALPMLQEGGQPRKEWREIVFLPNKQLQQGRMVGNTVMDFRRGETVTVQANQEIFANQRAPRPKHFSFTER